MCVSVCVSEMKEQRRRRGGEGVVSMHHRERHTRQCLNAEVNGDSDGRQRRWCGSVGGVEEGAAFNALHVD